MPARSSGTPPFPCPAGYGWDGRRFYRLPQELSRVSSQDDQGGSSSGTDRAQGSSTGGRKGRRGRDSRGSLRESDGQTGEGEDDGGSNEGQTENVPPSAFYFTPAHPPAYFSSHQGGQSMWPANRPPSLALSVANRRRIQRRHVSALRYHSRDVVLEDLWYMSVGAIRNHSLQELKTLPFSGATLYVQTRVKMAVHHASPSPYCSHVYGRFLDQGGRTRGGERYLDQYYDPTCPASICLLAEASRNIPFGNYSRFHHGAYTGHRFGRRRTVPAPLEPRPNHGVNHIALASFAERQRSFMLNRDQYSLSDHVAVNFSFDRRRKEALFWRGVTASDWSYDSANPYGQLMVTAKLGPRFGSRRRGQEEKQSILQSEKKDGFVTVTYDIDEDGKYLCDLYLSTGSMSMQTDIQADERTPEEIEELAYQKLACPAFSPDASRRRRQDLRFTALASNEGSGLVWAGGQDGSIWLLDPLGQPWPDSTIRRPPAQRYWVMEQGPAGGGQEGNLSDTDEPARTGQRSLGQSNPLRWRKVDWRISRSFVTSLHAVGDNRVLVAFADGNVCLITASVDRQRTSVYMVYHGHVNDGDIRVPLTYDSDSDLFAIRGSDGFIRIWHLDSPYPLNSTWHASRNVQRSDPDPVKLTKSQRLINRLLPSKREAAQREADEKFMEYDRLMFGDRNPMFPLSASHVHGQRAPTPPLSQQSPTSSPNLATLPVRASVRLAFVYPSWLANRDSQWERTTRAFFPPSHSNGGARPRGLVDHKGELPALLLVDLDGADTNVEGRRHEDGIRFLWFEV